MSFSENGFEFFDLPMTKAILSILPTDDNDDVLLTQTIGFKAEKWVKASLFPFAASFPLDEDQQESGIAAACSYAASKYKLYNNNFEAATAFMKDANVELNSLITLLKASHTPRTRLVIASQDYDT